MDDDFTGAFKVRVADPGTGASYTELSLRTDYFE
jgi:hypothetical protein